MRDFEQEIMGRLKDSSFLALETLSEDEARIVTDFYSKKTEIVESFGREPVLEEEERIEDRILADLPENARSVLVKFWKQAAAYLQAGKDQ